MVVPALVLVERFAVVRIDDHDGVVEAAQRFELSEERGNAGVHVGNGAIVLRVHVVPIRDPLRHPRPEVVGERLECKDRFHGCVPGIALVAVIEEAIEGRGREIG